MHRNLYVGAMASGPSNSDEAEAPERGPLERTLSNIQTNAKTGANSSEGGDEKASFDQADPFDGTVGDSSDAFGTACTFWQPSCS